MKGRKPKYTKEALLELYDFKKSIVDNAKNMNDKGISISAPALKYMLREELNDYRLKQKLYSFKFYDKYKDKAETITELKRIIEDNEGVEFRSSTYLYLADFINKSITSKEAKEDLQKFLE